MLTRQAKLMWAWMILIPSVGWCGPVAAKETNKLDLPCEGFLKKPRPAFQIENKYEAKVLDPNKEYEKTLAILGSCRGTTPYGSTGTADCNTTGKLGGYDFGVEGIYQWQPDKGKGHTGPTPKGYSTTGRLGGPNFGVQGICRTKDGYGVRAENTATGGTGLYAKGGPNGAAGMFDGFVVVSSGHDIMLTASTEPADSGDIVFQTSGGSQKARIFTEPSGANGLHLTSGDNTPDLSISSNSNVGIGTASPRTKLEVSGEGDQRITLNSTSGVAVQLIASGAFDALLRTMTNHPLYLGTNNGWSVELPSSSDVGMIVKGKVRIVSQTNDKKTLIEFGEGLDYAEGFDVSDSANVSPGTVLVIDPQNPGSLTVSIAAYDTKVAGIVAGAKGLGSGVRLGTGQYDHDVALAGRVYCNVDATEGPVEPGDLLTTSATAGYAMKVSDHLRAQGAILGKAMERLEKGRKAQILVLVTLQ